MQTFRYPWNSRQINEPSTSSSSSQHYHHQQHPATKHFEAILDASTNIVDLAESLHSAHNASIETVRTHLHDSFEGQSQAEVLLMFDALGSRPKLQKIFLGFHRRYYASLPLQALSLSLLQASQLMSLEICGLALQGTPSDFVTLAASLQNHPSLQEIKLSNCRLASHNDTESDNSQDNDSNSQHNDYEEYALDALVRSLATIHTLRRMVLQSSLQDSLGKLRPETLRLLCHQTSNLQTIGLLGFSFQEEHLIALADGLCSPSSSPSSLKELYLGTIQLGAKGDLALARILRQSSTDCNGNKHSCSSSSLEYLDLQFQANESPVETALSLPQNTTLRHLFVHGNLSLSSQKAFAEGIQDNYYLQSLELMNGSAYLVEIRFYLRMNDLGRAELLLQPTISISKAKWVDKLVSQRNDAGALFYLLSRNPLLCDPLA